MDKDKVAIALRAEGVDYIKALNEMATVIGSIALHADVDDPSYANIVIARHCMDAALGVSVLFFEGQKRTTREPLGVRSERIALGDYASNLVEMSLTLSKFLRDVDADSDHRETGAMVCYAIRHAADAVNTLLISKEFKLHGLVMQRRADA